MKTNEKRKSIKTSCKSSTTINHNHSLKKREVKGKKNSINSRRIKFLRILSSATPSTGLFRIKVQHGERQTNRKNSLFSHCLGLFFFFDPLEAPSNVKREKKQHVSEDITGDKAQAREMCIIIIVLKFDIFFSFRDKKKRHFFGYLLSFCFYGCKFRAENTRGRKKLFCYFKGHLLHNRAFFPFLSHQWRSSLSINNHLLKALKKTRKI